MSSKSRSGFTLVEILTVIAIVVIISGIAVPAVMKAYSYAQASTLKLEVDAMANAIEQYRLKYGDYPPDGSSWTIFMRHCRKAFPRIAPTELALLDPTSDFSANCSVAFPRNDNDIGLSGEFQRVMEPSEAVVFFLGGFSDDPEHPFTGPGGPFILTGDSNQFIQYNMSRKNALFEFKQAKLTVEVVTVNTASNGPVAMTVSNDEWQFNNNRKASGGDPTIHYSTHYLDVLPAYLSRGLGAPFTYFDSRTYSQLKDGKMYFNYCFSPNYGCARPYKSDIQLTSGVAISAIAGSQDHKYQYVNPTSFQLQCAGLDNLYGCDEKCDQSHPSPNRQPYGLVSAATDAPVLFRFPSGDSDVARTDLKYLRLFVPSVAGNKVNSQDDNSANFSEIYLSAGANN